MKQQNFKGLSKAEAFTAEMGRLRKGRPRGKDGDKGKTNTGDGMGKREQGVGRERDAAEPRASVRTVLLSA